MGLHIAEAPAKAYPIISADSHFTEPADLWVTRLDKRYRDRAPHVEHRENTDVFVCDNTEMFPIGMIHGVRYKGGDVKLDGRYADVPPSGWDPQARIADMSRDGVDAEVLYPTIAMRFFAIEDTAFQAAVIAAYNDWASEFCTQSPQRFKGIGMVSLDDVPTAIAEMERIRDLGGLVGTMIAVFPDDTQPYHAEQYEPFWRAAEALRMPISLHTASERRVKHGQSPTDRFLHYTLVQRVFIGMIYAGLFDRYPELHVVSVENDAGWAANVIERMDYVDVKARFRNLHQDHLNREAPSHYWKRNISYTFMRDRAAIACRHLIGLDRIMWSSDFPHGDSTWPDSQEVIAEQFEGVPEDEKRAILHDNAARMYGFE